MKGLGGPETSESGELKAVYSRTERMTEGGYLSRKPERKGWFTSRRILLLDLVILFVFGAVLYPLLLKRQEIRFIEGYAFTLKLRKGKGLSGVEIFVSGHPKSRSSDTVEITLKGKKGNIFYRWTDTAPGEGETRTYMKAFRKGEVSEVILSLNGTKKAVSLVRFRLPAFLFKQKD